MSKFAQNCGFWPPEANRMNRGFAHAAGFAACLSFWCYVLFCQLLCFACMCNGVELDLSLTGVCVIIVQYTNVIAYIHNLHCFYIYIRQERYVIVVFVCLFVCLFVY